MIRDWKKIDQLLNFVVSARSNRVNGVQFSVAEPAKLLDQARRKAVKDAMRRVHLYADAAGSGWVKFCKSRSAERAIRNRA